MITQKQLRRFSQPWWKDGTWPLKKPLDFGGNLCDFTLGFGYVRDCG